MWPPIAPRFADASGNLGEEIRPVIELRLFESKSRSEIGATSDTSKAPDKMRLPRTLAKLRKTYSQRGVTLDADAHCRRGLGELVRLMHDENAWSPMLVTPLPIVMLIRLVQEANVTSLMLVTLRGSVAFVRLVRCSNALFPLLATLLGIVTLVTSLRGVA